MRAIEIILLCIAAAVVYGIVHDQVTARVCVEYFTIGHYPLFDTNDPTLLGIGWGIIATWWVGLLLGIVLAIVSRPGSRPKRSAGSLVRPVTLLLCWMALLSAAAGIVGWQLARHGVVWLVGPMAEAVPSDKHVPFITDLWAHVTSYLVALIGGVILIVRVWRSRSRA